VPLTVGALAQLLTGFFLSRFQSRRRFTATFSLIHALMFLPLLGTAFLGPARVPAVIAVLSMVSFFFMVPIPVWSSWMGDLVAEKTRGAYFGRRTSITGLVTFPSLLMAGFILQQARNGGDEYLGFATIFLIACAARAVSSFFLRKKYDPPYDYTPKRFIDLKKIFHERKNRNTLSLVLFLSLLNFSLMMIGPYIDIFMLRRLELDYVSFTVAGAVILVVKYLFMPFWGKAADRYGTRKVLVVGGVLISIVPFLWLFGSNLPLILLIQVYAGFSWAAFELSSFQFLIDTTGQENRAGFIAFYNAVNGIIGLAGSLTAGLLFSLADSWLTGPTFLAALAGTRLAAGHPAFSSPYLVIFTVSGVIRLGVVALFASRLKEVRSVTPINTRQLPLRVIGMMTNRGVVFGLSILGRRKKPSRTR
ncbi:MAG TPA: MFS transporter, partial [Spirochaetia bacterium]|nr:MFS transporter [Spirochaetia bacterium]